MIGMKKGGTNLMIQTKICIAGSSNMDLVTTVSRMPLPGETILGTGFKTVFGGKGANQAVIAAKLGADVAMIAKVGDDAFGEAYLRNYRDVGVRMDYIGRSKSAPTGIAAITVDADSRNSIIVVAGANSEVGIAEIEAARPAIREAKICLTQLEIPIPSVRLFFEIAREYGVTTILNPAPAAELDPELYPLCDFFCPNEIEAGMMSGVSVASPEDAPRAARVLLDRGVKAVLMTLGRHGAYYADRETAFLVPGLNVDAVDTTGAGDCFLGSFSVFYGEGNSVRAAIEKANRVAAMSVSRPGAQPSYPSRAETGL